MEELKKCPFCGNEDVTMGSRGNLLGIDIYIRCACGAKIQICEENGEEELIKRWNRRCYE